MTYYLSQRSKSRLEGVHPKLAAVVKKAITITPVDFTITCGVRSLEEQRRNVAKGASKTMRSKHLRQADGYSHAVDLAPIVSGRITWDWKWIYPMAASMCQACRELNVPLVWGACWDRSLNHFVATSEAMREAVEGYKSRRRALGKSAFLDGVHFQLNG